MKELLQDNNTFVLNDCFNREIRELINDTRIVFDSDNIYVRATDNHSFNVFGIIENDLELLFVREDARVRVLCSVHKEMVNKEYDTINHYLVQWVRLHKNSNEFNNEFKYLYHSLVNNMRYSNGWKVMIGKAKIKAFSDILKD